MGNRQSCWFFIGSNQHWNGLPNSRMWSGVFRSDILKLATLIPSFCFCFCCCCCCSCCFCLFLLGFVWFCLGWFCYWNPEYLVREQVAVIHRGEIQGKFRGNSLYDVANCSDGDTILLYGARLYKSLALGANTSVTHLINVPVRNL